MQFVFIPLDPAEKLAISKANIMTSKVSATDIQQLKSRIHNMRSITDIPKRVDSLTVTIPETILKIAPSSSEKATIDAIATSVNATLCIQLQKRIASIDIIESGEPFVELRAHFADAGLRLSVSTATYPDVSGPYWQGKPQIFWVRRSFANRLIHMAKLLDIFGIHIHIEEAFRPYDVQSGMFRRRITNTRNTFPDWSTEKVLAEAMTKTACSPRLASHMAGAAVDVFLVDSRTGQLLDFGHTYPDSGALVHPDSPFVTSCQWLNRKTLQVAAELSGLTLYPGEDWHISFGDNLAAAIRNKTVAQFGPIKTFNVKTGEILSVFELEEIDSTFST